MNGKWKVSFDKDNAISMEVREQELNGAVVYTVRAERKPDLPLFGEQTYFDPRKGVEYQLKGSLGERFMAVYQHKEWWVRPAFGSSFSQIPARTQLLLLQEGDTYTAVLSVCADAIRSDIRGSRDGLIVTAASNQNGCNKMEDVSLVSVEDTNPYQACERAVKTALLRMGREHMDRRQRIYPEMFEYFGWCSWDAFYHKVNAEGIKAKLDELKEKGIPAKWVLIDDGWMDADYDKQVLKGLDADRSKFPEGLGSFTKQIRKDYGIGYIGVWHAIMGYWNGLKEGSQAAGELSAGSRQLPDGRIIPKAEKGAAFRFYDKWHSYLKSQCGIDFIKVDGQSAVSYFYAGMESYGKASREIQKGLGASAALHFNNNIINCMGMASEDMWNRPASAISRSSDDFVPNVPHGFREHAIQNSYNSLLQGEFFYGDWDMFWSAHEENRQNSMLRAVSGGPVYISDGVGKTDPEYIMPLVMEDGRITRCEETGVPTIDSLFTDPVNTQAPLKIFNRYQDAYIVTALNINKEDRPCQGELRISNIPGLKGWDWYVYSFGAQKVCTLTQGEPAVFQLAPNDGELFVLVKKNGRGRVLGLVDKYVSLAGILELFEEDGHQTVLLRQGGIFGFVSEIKPDRVLCFGQEQKIIDRGNGLYLVKLCNKGKQLLDIYYKESHRRE